MGCAPQEGVNSTLFSIKRGFLRTVNFARKLLAPFGLTPARFDIMYLLRDGFRRQSQIWRRLGLHPSTVCRVMIQLDLLGLVHRNVDNDNFREVIVKLSRDGRNALNAAIR